MYQLCKVASVNSAESFTMCFLWTRGQRLCGWCQLLNEQSTGPRTNQNEEATRTHEPCAEWDSFVSEMVISRHLKHLLFEHPIGGHKVPVNDTQIFSNLISWIELFCLIVLEPKCLVCLFCSYGYLQYEKFIYCGWKDI